MTAAKIGTTYAAWLASTPAVETWADLPFTLGLVSDHGGAWDDFIKLAPNRDLPTFVIDAIPASSRADLDLPRLTAAHHYAAMHGIVTDRMVDDQCRVDGLRIVRRALLQRWLDELGAGVRDSALARRVLGEAARDWRRGLGHERRLLAGTADGWDIYASAVVLRLRWVSATATAMLCAAGAPAAAVALRATYDRFLLALQIMDDHDDRAEDERTRGAVFRCVQDLPGGPRPLAAQLVASAARRAADGGLPMLGRWLADFAHLLLLDSVRPRARAN